MTKVAVYGSLRKGMHNNPLLGNSEFLGSTVTAEPYAMYSLGGFPMVQLTGEKVCPIVVEVFEVDDAVHQRLDQLEGFRGKGRDNFYDCSLVQTVDFGEVLMYHIEDRTNNRLVENGDWVDFYKTKRTY